LWKTLKVFYEAAGRTVLQSVEAGRTFDSLASLIDEEEGRVMDKDQVELLAKREALLRAANEEIARIDAGFSTDGAALEIVCECARSDCAELMAVSPTNYRKTRSEPRRFLLVAGHELSELERVVDRYDGFVVVEKVEPTAAAIAEETAPHD
jgi:hypothetical protein